MSDYDYLIKCLIIGDSGIGKSAMMIRFTDDIFKFQFISTIGVDFKIKTIDYKDKKIKFQIWDTAGQERFRTITSSYYHGADVVLICYDVTDKETFNNLEKWLDEIKQYSATLPQIILCGTKNDLEIKRAVLYNEGKEFAQKNNMLFFETSSKNNVNITEIFNSIADAYVEKKNIFTYDVFNKDDLRQKKVVKFQKTTDILVKPNKCC